MARKKDPNLTPKEEEVMQMLWTHGPLKVREMQELYPEPRPHVNTISTVVRSLEEKGYVGHESTGWSFRYHHIYQKNDFRKRSLGKLVKSYFDNNYLGAVSTLVEEEKISVDDLKELINIIENNKNNV